MRHTKGGLALAGVFFTFKPARAMPLYVSGKHKTRYTLTKQKEI